MGTALTPAQLPVPGLSSCSSRPAAAAAMVSWRGCTGQGPPSPAHTGTPSSTWAGDGDRTPQSAPSSTLAPTRHNVFGYVELKDKSLCLSSLLPASLAFCWDMGTPFSSGVTNPPAPCSSAPCSSSPLLLSLSCSSASPAPQALLFPQKLCPSGTLLFYTPALQPLLLLSLLAPWPSDCLQVLQPCQGSHLLLHKHYLEIALFDHADPVSSPWVPERGLILYFTVSVGFPAPIFLPI